MGIASHYKPVPTTDAVVVEQQAADAAVTLRHDATAVSMCLSSAPSQQQSVPRPLPPTPQQQVQRLKAQLRRERAQVEQTVLRELKTFLLQLRSCTSPRNKYATSLSNENTIIVPLQPVHGSCDNYWEVGDMLRWLLLYEPADWSFRASLNRLGVDLGFAKIDLEPQQLRLYCT